MRGNQTRPFALQEKIVAAHVAVKGIVRPIVGLATNQKPKTTTKLALRKWIVVVHVVVKVTARL